MAEAILDITAAPFSGNKEDGIFIQVCCECIQPGADNEYSNANGVNRLRMKRELPFEQRMDIFKGRHLLYFLKE